MNEPEAGCLVYAHSDHEPIRLQTPVSSRFDTLPTVVLEYSARRMSQVRQKKDMNIAFRCEKCIHLTSIETVVGMANRLAKTKLSRTYHSEVLVFMALRLE